MAGIQPAAHRHRRRRRIAYLAREVIANGASIVLELNHYMFLFLIVGLLLHWRPRSFVQAIAAAVRLWLAC